MEYGTLFKYDLGILPNFELSDKLDTFVVPAVPRCELARMVNKEYLVADMFRLLQRYGFGSSMFEQELKLRNSTDVPGLYRLCALLVLVDERKKMQFLLQDEKYDFVPDEIGEKTMRDLRVWKREYQNYDSNFQQVVEHKIKKHKDELFNVMVMVENTPTFVIGDLILMMNQGNLFGVVAAFFDPYGRPAQHLMIGIRSGIARLLSCYNGSRTTSDKCFVRQLGMLMYSVRAYLANLDGSDFAMPDRPIGNMRKQIEEAQHDVQLMMRGRAPINKDIVRTYLDLLNTLIIPTWREPLGFETTARVFVDGCKGKTQEGAPCRRKRSEDSCYCFQHGPDLVTYEFVDHRRRM